MAEDQKETAKEDKPEQAVVVFRYQPEPGDQSGYPGVPPGDILQEQYEQYPAWIQKSIAESPTSPYKAVEAKKAPDKAKDGEK